MDPEGADAEIRAAPADDLFEVNIQRAVAEAVNDRALARATGGIAKHLDIVGERKLVALRRPSTAFASPVAAELFAIPNVFLCR